ncbi:hypothetical protein ACFWD7_31545 [Streptomyces mirabilis]|uniref:hypothetical protein n=1 Tax=Streptomyces mirabilis TaxID=68239 RepID=UPI0021C0AC24|nr:hypothetical protein [Streptomyces mirabilis]MCT9112543.1 hypothetical protein [Streptomyces mirabilis]
MLAKIAEMQDSDRIKAERVHAVITAGAPVLAPKLWFGIPAYALDGEVVCFFQSAAKFTPIPSFRSAARHGRCR